MAFVCFDRSIPSILTSLLSVPTGIFNPSVLTNRTSVMLTGIPIAVIPVYRHLLLLRMLVLLGVISFGVFLAFQYGFVDLFVSADRSYLSSVILTIYLALTMHWVWVGWLLSRDLNYAAMLDGDSVPSGTASLTSGLIERLESSLGGARRERLLSLYYDQLMNRHAFGHFATDVLLRLGLLGTIIGFIFMLLPVADIKDFDGAVMQRLLASMSGGMAVALYTTLAGLVSSTLLRFQYHVLDSAAVDLANRVSTHVETRIGLGVDET